MTDRRRSFLSKWANTHQMTAAEAMQRFPEEVQIKRFGQPEEVADLLAFLVSPEAKWMTGTALRIDGGEIKNI